MRDVQGLLDSDTAEWRGPGSSGCCGGSLRELAALMTERGVTATKRANVGEGEQPQRLQARASQRVVVALGHRRDRREQRRRQRPWLACPDGAAFGPSLVCVPSLGRKLFACSFPHPAME